VAAGGLVYDHLANAAGGFLGDDNSDVTPVVIERPGRNLVDLRNPSALRAGGIIDNPLDFNSRRAVGAGAGLDLA
jgi:hypothetical protein